MIHCDSSPPTMLAPSAAESASSAPLAPPSTSSLSAPISSSRPPPRAASRHVLDEAARRRRARKALESLERDNFHEDPHAGLVMSKKALSLFQDEADSSSDKKADRRRRTRTAEYYKQRFRKSFAQLLEEEASANPDPPNYLSAQAPAPDEKRPPRHFCAVCGFFSRYCCVVCGARYCSIQCQETHNETRCLKWTA